MIGQITYLNWASLKERPEHQDSATTRPDHCNNLTEDIASIISLITNLPAKPGLLDLPTTLVIGQTIRQLLLFHHGTDRLLIGRIVLPIIHIVFLQQVEGNIGFVHLLL